MTIKDQLSFKSDISNMILKVNKNKNVGDTFHKQKHHTEISKKRKTKFSTNKQKIVELDDNNKRQ